MQTKYNLKKLIKVTLKDKQPFSGYKYKEKIHYLFGLIKYCNEPCLVCKIGSDYVKLSEFNKYFDSKRFYFNFETKQIYVKFTVTLLFSNNESIVRYFDTLEEATKFYSEIEIKNKFEFTNPQ